MIVGSIGYILSLGTTAWAFYYYGSDFTQLGSIVLLSSLLVFIASPAFGQKAVIWGFISEIFPTECAPATRPWAASPTGSYAPRSPGRFP